MTHFLSRFGFAALAAVALTVSAYAVPVEAGPIWNNDDAAKKCPKLCESQTWNGEWWTTVWGKMSVCATTSNVSFPVGPIWNNDDAAKKCPAQLSKVKWNGQWWTTVWGKMSVCDCEPPPPLPN